MKKLRSLMMAFSLVTMAPAAFAKVPLKPPHQEHANHEEKKPSGSCDPAHPHRGEAGKSQGDKSRGHTKKSYHHPQHGPKNGSPSSQHHKHSNT